MKKQIQDVLNRAKTGTLSVIDFESGGPFGAAVNVASTAAGLPFFLFSNLARHTKCLRVDDRASLLVAELAQVGDALTGFRATITGRVREATTTELRSAYLAKHPYAEGYVDFGDFHFWTMQPEKIFTVGGFGRIQAYDAHEIFGALKL